MGRTASHTFGLSASDAVLGLLIEGPGNSYQLEQRLQDRFGSAQFGHGTAYHAVQRLSKQGLIRVLADDHTADPPGGDAERLSGTAYEATAKGNEQFERWLRASTPTPPVREELLAQITFCGPADVPRMIGIIREAELACTTQPEDLNGRIGTERQPAEDDEWRRRMGAIVTDGEAAWLNARILWLKKLRAYLQREGQAYDADRRSASSLPRA